MTRICTGVGALGAYNKGSIDPCGPARLITPPLGRCRCRGYHAVRNGRASRLHPSGARVPAVGDVDPEALAGASRRYARLRRMLWRSFFGMWALIVASALCGFALGREGPGAPRAILMAALAAGVLACWLACIGAWCSLLGLRCPRCGGRFLLSRWSSWPEAACKHCGQPLG